MFLYIFDQRAVALLEQEGLMADVVDLLVCVNGDCIN
jgi:hypothetical protein